MTEYRAAAVHDLDGNFLGYGINVVGLPKLKGTNLYSDEEADSLRAALAQLNEGANVASHWPAKDDPELIALLNDPAFYPIEYTEEDVVDEVALEAALQSGKLTAIQDPISQEVRWEPQERIPLMRAKVPADPAAPQERYRRAAEQIANKRASGVDATN